MAPSAEASKDKTRNLISRITGESAGQIEDSAVLADLRNWDSFAILEMMLGISDELGVKLEAEQVGECRTVGDLLTAVCAGEA